MSGVREDFRGDYLGFSYNGKHSSELGIVRTSSGSRFNENLLPTIQDKTVQVPGGDGTYFFGSYYTQRQISVPFAFDRMTEEQFREMRKIFGDKKIHDLTFDEAPYKIYRAKVTGTAQIKHLVFDQENRTGADRVYKGEGTIQFTCYSPYAICTRKGLSDYLDWERTGQWEDASGLPETWHEITNTMIRSGSWDFINAGDIEAPFQLGLCFDITNDTIPEGQLSIPGGGYLTWSKITKQGEDSLIVFDSRNNLIEGYLDNEGTVKSGNVYNQYITGGNFFHLPLGESSLTLTNGASAHGEFFRYDYYYI